MALPTTVIDALMIRTEISETAYDAQSLVLSTLVNRWGFKSPDSAEMAKYWGVAPGYLTGGHSLGVFRGYDHRWRAYTWDKVVKHASTSGSNHLIGMVLYSRVINSAISDDPSGDVNLPFRTNFYYKNSSGSWVSAGYEDWTINKVGNVTFSKTVEGSLGNYGSTDVRMVVQAMSTPALRWDGSALLTVENESETFYYEDYEAGAYSIIHNYDLFSNLVAIQSSSLAGIYDQDDLDFWVYNMDMSNFSKYNLDLTFKATFALNSSFTGNTVVAYSNGPHLLSRSWELPYDAATIGTVQSPILFEGITNPHGWTYGADVYVKIEIDDCIDADTSLDRSSMIETQFPYSQVKWYYT